MLSSKAATSWDVLPLSKDVCYTKETKEVQVGKEACTEVAMEVDLSMVQMGTVDLVFPVGKAINQGDEN